MFHRLPFAVTGVALGLTGLGNLLGSFLPGFRLVSCSAAIAILLCFLVKCILKPQWFLENMAQPVSAGVSGTFCMAWMLLSGFLSEWIGTAAAAVWFLGLLLQILLMGYYSIRFLPKLQLKDCYPVLFVVYAGTGAVALTAESFGLERISLFFLYLSFALYLFFLPILAVRYLRFPDVPGDAKPTFCILASPACLCLAGYLTASPAISPAVVFCMLLLSSAIYWIVLWKLPKLLTIPFYPSYAGFTFPFVIKATSMTKAAAWLAEEGFSVPLIPFLATAETCIAVILVFYVLIRYAMFLILPLPNDT